jgi:predicted porin|tara:strand:+ start:109 stop:1068 length:960 start_codon:yes stop_codon:yes gene_type:complete
MKLIKSTITFALCSVFAQPAIADETVNLYGKLNLSIQATEEGDESFSELKSNASRLGVKGKYKLDTDYGLEAIYKIEWQVNVEDGSKDTFTARNQWVGLKGGFGEFTVGRVDTTLKLAQGKFDLFNDYEGDLKNLFIGENRVTDSLTYKSPKYNNVQFSASYILSEDEDLDNPYSVGVSFGDGSLKKTDFFLSIARDENMKGKSAAYQTTRLVGMYKFGDLRLGGILTESEVSEGEFQGQSENGYAVNASYKLGKVLAKVQYQEFADADAINVGADYKLGKNTKVYAWYTDREGLSFNADTIKKATEGSYFAVGMEQKF